MTVKDGCVIEEGFKYKSSAGTMFFVRMTPPNRAKPSLILGGIPFGVAG